VIFFWKIWLAPTALDFETAKTEANRRSPGSAILGCSQTAAAKMETGPSDRDSGNRYSLASDRVPALLELAFAT
jgi:hypothetical protein